MKTNVRILKMKYKSLALCCYLCNKASADIILCYEENEISVTKWYHSNCIAIELAAGITENENRDVHTDRISKIPANLNQFFVNGKRVALNLLSDAYRNYAYRNRPYYKHEWEIIQSAYEHILSTPAFHVQA